MNVGNWTGECKVILMCKLHVNYVFHTLEPSDKNGNKMNACCKSLLGVYTSKHHFTDNYMKETQ